MSTPSPAPTRVIGGLGAFALVSGSMLGVGIFLAPPLVAAELHSSFALFALFVLGALTALAGSVACAELGALMPRSGGDYVFQREAFGPAVAFASGSVLFVAIFAGSIATLAVALAEYQLPVLFGVQLHEWRLGGTGITGRELSAVLIVVTLTALNLTGTRPSAAVQTASTLLPLFAFFGLAVVALAVLEPAASAPVAAAQAPTAGGLARAYNSVYFAYAGWINVIYVAGEVRRPERNLPRALIGGTLVVAALYLVICLAFVSGLGIDGLARSGEAGSALAERLGGTPLRWVVTACIATAIVACTNATVLGGARILPAMAGELGVMPWVTGSSRSGVPARVLLLQAAWSIVLILSGGFDALLQMVSVAMVLTGSLTVASLFVLRFKQPAAHRPYRALLYPWLPGLYLVSSLLTVAVMLYTSLTTRPQVILPWLGVPLLLAAYLAHPLFRSAER